MEHCRAYPCVYTKIVEGVVELILVHVDDILVIRKEEACGELHHTLNETFPNENLTCTRPLLGHFETLERVL